MDLQDLILEKGKSIGMCEKYQKILQLRMNIDKLCGLYHSGLDFCIEKKFPDDSIISLIDKTILERNGIFYSTKDKKVFDIRNIVVNGDSDLDIYVTSVSDITIRDNSVCRIHLLEGSYAYITLRDKSIVYVAEKRDKSRILMSYFSGDIKNADMFDKINYK